MSNESSNPKASYTVEDVRESARGWVGHSTTDTAIGEEILAHRALWAADEIERLRDRVHSEEFVVMFLGYLTGKLPELHRVEAPRVMDAWNEFKREMGKQPARG